MLTSPFSFPLFSRFPKCCMGRPERGEQGQKTETPGKGEKPESETPLKPLSASKQCWLQSDARSVSPMRPPSIIYLTGACDQIHLFLDAQQSVLQGEIASRQGDFPLCQGPGATEKLTLYSDLLLYVLISFTYTVIARTKSHEGSSYILEHAKTCSNDLWELEKSQNY